MCTGIALAESEVPLGFLERFEAEGRVFTRGGEREVRFLFRSAARFLPVWQEGQFRVARWGCRRGETKRLPLTGWTWKESFQRGLWAESKAGLVVIPATMGLESGIWYRIRQGVQGVLVSDESGAPVVYVLCEPATHYYQNMTRSERMPVLLGELI